MLLNLLSKCLCSACVFLYVDIFLFFILYKRLVISIFHFGKHEDLSFASNVISLSGMLGTIETNNVEYIMLRSNLVVLLSPHVIGCESCLGGDNLMDKEK